MNEICLSCRKHTKCGRAIHETIGFTGQKKDGLDMTKGEI